MVWKNDTFATTEELTEWASENNIDFKRNKSFVIQDKLGNWHLFHEE